jgi:hypothetical protein
VVIPPRTPPPASPARLPLPPPTPTAQNNGSVPRP